MNDVTTQGAGWCERLYDESAPSLLLYGRALGLGACEAEDVLHDTFLALMRLPCQPDLPRAYVIRSFRNRALNCRRSFWRRVAREFESRQWFEPGQEVSPWEPAAMRALAALPTDQREAIVLKIWHHLTFEAIGELMGRSPNTVAGRYRYGLQKLRRSLKECEHEQVGCAGRPSPLLETPWTIGEAEG